MSVHEVYYTLQGEGARSGRPAVFCRFSGCNLWTGREMDRSSAICRFCDTEFRGVSGPLGGRYDVARLASTIKSLWPANHATGYVVFTGGEPLLQLTSDMTEAVHHEGFEVAVETNGTMRRPSGVDWLTCSPKAGTSLVIDHADELKLVFPQEVDPGYYDDFEAQLRYLSPLDGPDLVANTEAVVDYCLGDPRWMLSMQTHKLIGLP